MENKRELLNHFLSMQDACRAIEAQAYLNMETFIVDLKVDKWLIELYPQFVAAKEGRWTYQPLPVPGVNRFAGWRPYSFASPFSCARKLQFKALLEKHGVSTPEYSLDPGFSGRNVIIKRTISTFGKFIRGPFKSAQEQSINPEIGEYYEKFTPGKIIKVWYWNDRPIVAEIQEMPAVVGDGQSTISELIERMPQKAFRESTSDRITPLIHYFGFDDQTVLPAGQRQIIEFRYVSHFSKPEDIEEVTIETCSDKQFSEPLGKVGEIIWQTLKAERMTDRAYTVDAIWDQNNQLWFLEANPNPFMHPFVYAPMLQTLAARLRALPNLTPSHQAPNIASGIQS